MARDHAALLVLLNLPVIISDLRSLRLYSITFLSQEEAEPSPCTAILQRPSLFASQTSHVCPPQSQMRCCTYTHIRTHTYTHARAYWRSHIHGFTPTCRGQGGAEGLRVALPCRCGCRRRGRRPHRRPNLDIFLPGERQSLRLRDALGRQPHKVAEALEAKRLGDLSVTSSGRFQK